MIGILDVQQALITTINAIGGSVPSAAEFRYQGETYTYPCVRVRVNDMAPEYRNGNCIKMGIDFEVIVFSELPSSLQASTIAKLIQNAVAYHVMTIGGNSSSPVRVSSLTGPLPLGEDRGWAEHIMFACDVQTS